MKRKFCSKFAFNFASIPVLIFQIAALKKETKRVTNDHNENPSYNSLQSM